MAIFDKVWEKVEQQFHLKAEALRIESAEEARKLQLLSDLDKAKTPEELDSVLEKIMDSRTIG